jgi:hypothetical protein
MKGKTMSKIVKVAHIALAAFSAAQIGMVIYSNRQMTKLQNSTADRRVKTGTDKSKKMADFLKK